MKYTIQILFLITCTNLCAQMSEYSYAKELKGIKNQWHTLDLPDDIYGEVEAHLNDIRILGITSSGDTVEAPYIRQEMRENISSDELKFKIINQSSDDKGYYFTFQMSDKQIINRIRVGFTKRNYDHRVKLEGSQNQVKWLTILEDYRLLSIRNQLTDYKFNTLYFPDTDYRYFRLFIPGNESPGFHKAEVALRKIKEGKYRNYTTQNVRISEDKKNKQTVINLDLGMPVPVSYLKIEVKNDFDYYRPIAIQYLQDSFKTDKGWHYNYRTFASGTLSSVETNELKFDNIVAQKLKITIRNEDNTPLNIGDITVKGYVNELTARFTESATYYLTYGNPKARRPQYDITRFTDKIPSSLTELKFGVTQKIDKKEIVKTSPLFENKAWLWAVMLAIIGLLGWFTIQMMRKK